MTDDEILKVVQAHKDGKPIQFRWKPSDEWKDTSEPAWDFGSYEYRVKPHYVPYDSIDEIDRGKLVRLKIERCSRQIVMFDQQKNKVIPFFVTDTLLEWRTLKEMFDDWEYEDGTTFGKKVEE